MPKYSEKVVCPDCGVEYSYSNVSAHRKTKRHLSGRPVQVVSVGEQKEIRPEIIDAKVSEGREIKIPLAPPFTLPTPENKNEFKLNIRLFPVSGQNKEIYQYRRDNEKLFRQEKKLKPSNAILRSDSVAIINQKLENLTKSKQHVPASSIYAIEEGALARHKQLLLKFSIKDPETDLSQRNPVKYVNADFVKILPLRNDEMWKYILANELPEFVHDEIKKRVRNILNANPLFGRSDNKYVSEDWRSQVINQIFDYEIIFSEDSINVNANFGYFEYFNLTDIDLSKYQVYKKTDSAPYEQCLIHTLKMCEISDEDIKKCLIYVSKVEKSETGVVFKPVQYIQTTKLKEIANIIKKTINVEYFKECRENRIEKKTYGDFKESIDVGIFGNHLFINDELPYTKYSISNYIDVKDKPNFHRIYNSSRHYKDVKISVCSILSLMFKSKLLEKIENVIPENLQSVHHFTNENLLDNLENEQRLFNYNEKTDIKMDIFYGDFENINSNVKNIPFLGGVIHENKKEPTLFVGLDCVTKFLDYVINVTDKRKQTVIYFHNLKYDFALMKSFVNIFDICEKDGMIYSVNIFHKGRKILLKDSYKLFSKSLFNFGKAFKLDVSKEEGIAYDYYTLENYMEEKTLIKNYMEKVKPNEQKQFLKNIEGKFQNDGLYFDSLAYYLHYLNLDIVVLQQAMKKFDELMIKTFDRSIHKHLTISSYADNYFIRNGCYDGIYEVKGNLRHYLSNSIYGGRVNVLERVKKTCVEDKINDFDAVSLYPSAISRLCRESGFPIGDCKRWNSLIDLKNVSTYVVTVCITKINKKQNNPFIAYRHDSKIDYINELTNGPLVVVIDKITLEDYIEYHQIEYSILDGVYWNKGFNNTFGEKIEFIFNERLKQKSLKTDQGDILQEIYKLMMNSAYGKTILSSTDGNKIIKDEKHFLKYMFKNYNTVEYAQKINENQYIITQHKTDESYNRAICGINILSMSKRIMNEVMGLASENKIDVFYQDTDSMHMLDRDIPKLVKLFKEKYDKELIGNKMSQFHSDFSLGNCKNVVAIRSYFLGKKCYLDVLEGKNMDGKIENGYHIRMKGISESAFDDIAKGDPETIYKKLCNGETIRFNLTNSNSVKFKFSCDGVKKLVDGSFTRDVKF